jgi:hypothetical protein
MTDADLIRVSARPDPFTDANTKVEIPEGATVSEILETIQPDPAYRAYGHVWIGDQKIDRKYWGAVRPKAGTAVTVRLALGGGGAVVSAMIDVDGQ